MEGKARILVADDQPDNLLLLEALLSDDYAVTTVTDGAAVLQHIETAGPPDLFLLDVMMPGLDGFELCRHIKAMPATCDVPVIFLTGMTEMKDEQRGLDLGAADYITKPPRPPIVLARVHTQLELKRARDRLKDQNTLLEAEITRRMAENQLVQEVSIHALARLAETRDPETGNHLRRTQEYVRTLGRQLQGHRRFSHILDDRTIVVLAKSAPLHDIGKVGIPDHILLKPGKLSPDEWEIMKTHTWLGSEAIAQAERDAHRPVAFLSLAKEIARWHHERWDGRGYPDGLAGDAIPVSARLMSLADVFDALISRRVYKEPFSFVDAREMIVAERGHQFDADVVDAFLGSYDEFRNIAQCFSDSLRPEPTG